MTASTHESEQRTTRAVIDGFYAAYARRDVDTMMTYVSDAIVEDLSGVGLVTGRLAEERFLRSLFAAFPDLHTEVTRVVIDKNSACVEWQRHGTFTGADFHGTPATGRPFQFKGGAFIDVADGLITRINGYYDTAVFARAIGALPPEGSKSERFAMALLRLRTAYGRRRRRRALEHS
ncbi:ester cyclase [Nocardia cyriacigeorgica]|uniref:ester cyclase n=1 Tax=Nocardia cyriacigeorgica TaxID=135487 RepID=UPI002457BA08|nr:nuclear transport factor 2 family protein [Nocardia cyriacigeorgica]